MSLKNYTLRGNQHQIPILGKIVAVIKCPLNVIKTNHKAMAYKVRSHDK